MPEKCKIIASYVQSIHSINLACIIIDTGDKIPLRNKASNLTVAVLFSLFCIFSRDSLFMWHTHTQFSFSDLKQFFYLIHELLIESKQFVNSTIEERWYAAMTTMECCPATQHSLRRAKLTICLSLLVLLLNLKQPLEKNFRSLNRRGCSAIQIASVNRALALKNTYCNDYKCFACH